MIYYIVAELPKAPKLPSIYDSRSNKSIKFGNLAFRGKRQLLLHYLGLEDINDVISIYEYVLPDNRSQIVCWFKEEGTDQRVEGSNFQSPIQQTIHNE